MLNTFVNNFKDLDEKVKNIMKYGFIFSLIFCLVATFILYTYEKLNSSPIVFIVGTILFKTSIVFFVSFTICGIAFDKIIKEKP